MANDENLKSWKKGQSGNPKGRPKGARNRSTIAKKWLEVEAKSINPISGQEETMSQEDMIYLALLRKARQGDVRASETILNSAYGQAKETLDLNADVPSINFDELFNFDK